MKQVFEQLGAFILVVTQNPIIGRSKQSMGNNTFTTYKGLNVLKSKPFSVANPKTAGQRAQRNALAKLVAFYRALKVILNIGFKQAANPLSPYNWFIKNNLPSAIDVTDPDNVEFLWPNMVVSKGSLPITDITSATADESDSEVVVNWSSALSSPDFSATDKAYIMVFSEDTDEILVQSNGVITRNAGTATLTTTGTMAAGTDVAIYLFFVSADGLQVSDSVYMSETVVA